MIELTNFEIGAAINAAWPAGSLERVTAKIAFLDARHGLPAEDLRALGIDSPILRWKAARQFLRNERREVYRAVRRIWVMATFCDWAEGNAFRRGEKPSCQAVTGYLERYGDAEGIEYLRQQINGEVNPCTCPPTQHCQRLRGPNIIARDWLEAAARVRQTWGEAAMHYVMGRFCPHLTEKRQAALASGKASSG